MSLSFVKFIFQEFFLEKLVIFSLIRPEMWTEFYQLGIFFIGSAIE